MFMLLKYCRVVFVFSRQDNDTSTSRGADIDRCHAGIFWWDMPGSSGGVLAWEMRWDHCKNQTTFNFKAT